MTIQMVRLNNRGITLIGSIMLIVFATIAVLGVTTFIIQRLLQHDANIITTKCICLSQAGIHNAVYEYRSHDLTGNGYFSLGQHTIDSGNLFVLGAEEAELLMVNTSNAYTSEANQRLSGLTMQNATNSKTISIDRIGVTWDNAAKARSIWIDGSRIWKGNKTSPLSANVKDFTLDAIPTIYNIDYLEFNGDMSAATITIEFIMKDASNRNLTTYPASQDYSFTVRSTGKSTGSNIYRTVKADYNTLTAKVTAYSEISTEIIP